MPWRFGIFASNIQRFLRGLNEEEPKQSLGLRLCQEWFLQVYGDTLLRERKTYFVMTVNGDLYVSPSTVMP